MDRYDHLELDLECEDGGVAQKAALFGGMLKRSSKIIESPAPAQDSLSASAELSKSSESLNSNSSKEKGNIFKEMFKKTAKANKEEQPQETLSLQKQDLSASNDSLAGNNKSSKEKSVGLGGILKRPHKPGHARRASQDLLDSDLRASNDSLSDKSASKDSGGVFSGIFKKSHFGSRAQSQEDLSAPSERSGSNDNLSVNTNTKESGGVFSGIFKKSKPFGARTQSQEDLTAPSEVSGSNASQSVNSNNKESGGVFSGMFRKSPKPFAKAQSQEDLSASSELSGSNDNLSENNNTKEKGGLFGGVFRKKIAKSQSQDDLSMDIELPASSDSRVKKSLKENEKTEQPGDSNEIAATAEKPKAKQNGFSAMMKSTFYSDKKERNSDSDGEETAENGDEQHGQKQNKFAEAMTKLNPFRSANKQHEKELDLDDEDSPESNDKSSHNKQVKSNMIQRERKERSETPLVPPKPTEEEMKKTAVYNKFKQRGAEDYQSQSDDDLLNDKATPQESKATKVKRHKHHNPFMSRAAAKAQSDDEGLKQDDNSSLTEEKKEEDVTVKSEVNKPKRHNPFKPRVKASSDDEGLKDEEVKDENKDEEGQEKNETRVKKPMKHNPFMSRVKALSDDEGLKEDDNSSSKEDTKGEEGQQKTTEARVKRHKKHNPFMPKVKGRAQRNAEAAENAAENAGGNRSLFDRLEDLRVDPLRPEDRTDVEDLMEWWDNVESWEDAEQDDDMTEKEEAKAFAVTADKVQKGIRVFNKLFSERAESLWQHVIDLNSLADGLDKFNKNTKIAQITGGSTSAIGGVATIAGLALAPVTMGTSLIVTAVGLGVAAAGGLTSAGAGISNQVNNSMDRKKVEKIVQDYQEKMEDLNKCLKFIKQGIENLKKFDLIKMKNHAYNRDFPVLSSSFYEDGAMAGKAILINANEIMRVVQIANVAGSTAARAVQIASMATGVLTGLFVGMDIYFVAKDSKELKKGAKSEFAAKIREVATQLHDGLVELNTIREELQSTSPENNQPSIAENAENEKKEKEFKYSDSEEDEIDRIKKELKKDYETREYV